MASRSWRYSAWIAVGSNLGDRHKWIDQATEMLATRNAVIASSKLHETAPIGADLHGTFLNGAIKVSTDLDPEQLLEFCQSIEHQLGRDRATGADRTLDLDVLLVFDHASGQWLVRDTDPIIPHPRMWQRSFVLDPLAEVISATELEQARAIQTKGS